MYIYVYKKTGCYFYEIDYELIMQADIVYQLIYRRLLIFSKNNFLLNNNK